MKLYLGGYYNFYVAHQDSWMDVHLEAPARLSQVLTGLGIPPEEVHLAVVNREIVDLDTIVVTDRDEVRLYPPVSGGLMPWQSCFPENQ